jgi:hypothetical protein
MRRERESPLSSPVFPYLGCIMLGWALTWAGVELKMLQRLLDTVSLTGGQWLTVIALSIVAPAAVGIDKAIQLTRQNKVRDREGYRTRVVNNRARSALSRRRRTCPHVAAVFEERVASSTDNLGLGLRP